MSKRTLAYVATTGLLAFALYGSGLLDLARAGEVVRSVERLGYPAYMASILGLWKLLAVPAILVKGFPRLKEWAYAGVFFDLSGAIISHLVRDDAAGVIVPALLLALTMASWSLRPASRRFASPRERAAEITCDESPSFAITVA